MKIEYRSHLLSFLLFPLNCPRAGKSRGDSPRSAGSCCGVGGMGRDHFRTRRPQTGRRLQRSRTPTFISSEHLRAEVCETHGHSSRGMALGSFWLVAHHDFGLEFVIPVFLI